jgi:uncharacterized protein (UPF0276 family)
MSDEKLDRFVGWSIRQWSLLPQLGMTLSLINFRAPLDAEYASIWAKIVFSEPKSVEFIEVKLGLGLEIDIEKAFTSAMNNGFEKYEFLTSRDGKIIVVAKQVSWIFSKG